MFPNQKTLKDVNIGGKLTFLNVYLEDKIEDTNGTMTTPVKDRQHNGKMIKVEQTNNDLQSTTQKTKDRATRTQALRDGRQFLLY